MVKKIKIGILIFLTSFLLVNSAIPVHAQDTKTWSTIQTSTGQGKCVGTGNNSDVATIQGFECLFYNIIQVIVYFAGIAFFFMFVVGGFKYLSSGGDSKKTAAASSTLTMSIIGIVGIIVSWLIISLIHNFTGIDVTKFVIPG